MSQAYPSTCPRTLQAFPEACAKLGIVCRPGSEALDR